MTYEFAGYVYVSDEHLAMKLFTIDGEAIRRVTENDKGKRIPAFSLTADSKCIGCKGLDCPRCKEK